LLLLVGGWQSRLLRYREESVPFLLQTVVQTRTDAGRPVPTLSFTFEFHLLPSLRCLRVESSEFTLLTVDCSHYFLIYTSIRGSVLSHLAGVFCRLDKSIVDLFPSLRNKSVGRLLLSILPCFDLV